MAPANALTVSGHSVWAGVAPTMSRSTDSGKHWSKLPFRCPADAPDASAVAAASPASVALACTNPSFPQPGSSHKDVFTSANGGRTFHLAGHPAEPGNTGLLAMPPGNPQVITLTATSGASYLYRSADSGKTWRMATYFDGGLGFRDLAYASATTGYLVHYGAPYDMRTAIWHYNLSYDYVDSVEFFARAYRADPGWLDRMYYWDTFG